MYNYILVSVKTGNIDLMLLVKQFCVISICCLVAITIERKEEEDDV